MPVQLIPAWLMPAWLASVQPVLHAVREGLFLALLLSAPIVLSAVLAGFLMSVLQAATRISEPSLGFVARLAACVLGFTVAASWMFTQMRQFAVTLLHSIPSLGLG